jgi:hypothetical protein
MSRAPQAKSWMVQVLQTIGRLPLSLQHYSPVTLSKLARNSQAGHRASLRSVQRPISLGPHFCFRSGPLPYNTSSTVVAIFTKGSHEPPFACPLATERSSRQPCRRFVFRVSPLELQGKNEVLHRPFTTGRQPVSGLGSQSGNFPRSSQVRKGRFPGSCGHPHQDTCTWFRSRIHSLYFFECLATLLQYIPGQLVMQLASTKCSVA